MNSLPKYLLLLPVVFAASCATIRAQDATSSSAQSEAVPSPTLTADGVPSCPNEDKSHSLPVGVYRVGGGVSPPIPMKTPQAKLSDEARRFAKAQHPNKFEAISIVGLTVDTNGMPQGICILREAGYGLDRNAFEAVSKYRFKPASKDNKPIPVRLAVEVNFKIY